MFDPRTRCFSAPEASSKAVCPSVLGARIICSTAQPKPCPASSTACALVVCICRAHGAFAGASCNLHANFLRALIFFHHKRLKKQPKNILYHNCCHNVLVRGSVGCLHACLPSSQVWSPSSPHFWNQAPPAAQQLRSPFGYVAHRRHVLAVSIVCGNFLWPLGCAQNKNWIYIATKAK